MFGLSIAYANYAFADPSTIRKRRRRNRNEAGLF